VLASDVGAAAVDAGLVKFSPRTWVGMLVLVMAPPKSVVDVVLATVVLEPL
jgi:hypothetical protein